MRNRWRVSRLALLAPSAPTAGQVTPTARLKVILGRSGVVMRMKRIAGALVAGLVVAGTSQVASAQSSNTEVIAFRGFGATAVFNITEGCIKTQVIVVASETSAPGQPTGKQDSAAVLLDRRNTDACGGETLLFGSGSGPVKFDVAPLLSSAELHGVVPVNDTVSGRTLDVAVDVVWTGVGDLERNAVHYSFEDDGVVVRVHQNGSARKATAAGHVVADTTELVPNGSSADFADLAFSNEGQVLINRGA
jgi:hypothetical protein